MGGSSRDNSPISSWAPSMGGFGGFGGLATKSANPVAAPVAAAPIAPVAPNPGQSVGPQIQNDPGMAPATVGPQVQTMGGFSPVADQMAPAAPVGPQIQTMGGYSPTLDPVPPQPQGLLAPAAPMSPLDLKRRLLGGLL